MERSWLLKWIAACPHVAESRQVLPRLDEGSEHIVYLDQTCGDVIKVTRPGTYGDLYYLENGRVAQSSTSPWEYLVRVRLVSKHFGLKWSAIGMTEVGQIVTRQRFIAGSPPTQAQVDEFLLNADLVPVRQQCWLWKHVAEGGIERWIGDARADNFVLTENGLVPVDLRMWNVVREAGAPDKSSDVHPARASQIARRA